MMHTTYGGSNDHLFDTTRRHYFRLVATSRAADGLLAILRIKKSVMIRLAKWLNRQFVVACMPKTSKANTGLQLFGFALEARNGLTAAVVKVLATNNPIVACNPINDAPAPRTLIIAPFSNILMTSVRRILGALSLPSESKNCRNFLERRTYPNDQNVDKNPVTTPKRVKYIDVCGLCCDVNAIENKMTTAETIVKTNWNQKDIQPYRLHTLQALSRFCRATSGITEDD